MADKKIKAGSTEVPGKSPVPAKAVGYPAPKSKVVVLVGGANGTSHMRITRKLESPFTTFVTVTKVSEKDPSKRTYSRGATTKHESADSSVLAVNRLVQAAQAAGWVVKVQKWGSDAFTGETLPTP